LLLLLFIATEVFNFCEILFSPVSLDTFASFDSLYKLHDHESGKTKKSVANYFIVLENTDYKTRTGNNLNVY